MQQQQQQQRYLAYQQLIGRFTTCQPVSTTIVSWIKSQTDVVNSLLAVCDELASVGAATARLLTLEQGRSP